MSQRQVRYNCCSYNSIRIILAYCTTVLAYLHGNGGGDVGSNLPYDVRVPGTEYLRVLLVVLPLLYTKTMTFQHFKLFQVQK